MQPPSSEDGDGDEAMEDPSQQSQGATQSVPKLEPLPRDTDGYVNRREFELLCLMSSLVSLQVLLFA